MADINSALKQLRTAVSTLTKQIADLDANIEGLYAERSSITSAPVTKSDFVDFVRWDVEQKGQRSRKHLAHNLEGQNKSYSFLAQAIRHNGLPINYLVGQAGGSSPFITDEALFSLFGDKIVETVAAVVDGMEWPEPGLPIPEREKRLADLDGQIATLTQRRDELAAQLIDAGLAS